MKATMEAATTDRGRRRLGRRPVSVRITAAVVVLAGLALAGAGLVVYALETQDLDREIDDQITQEFDELEALARHTSASVPPQEMLRTFLQSNVPSSNELMVAFWGGEPQKKGAGSANGEFANDAVFVDTVNDLLTTDGGVTELDTEHGPAVVAVKPVRSETFPGADAAFAMVYFRSAEQTELADLTRTYAMVAAAALVALAIGAWSLSGRLLRPVRELRATAQEISETDLTQRIPASGNDDLTDLTRTFNAMLDRLEDAFAGQREFLNDAGHELRTPITIIRGHLELVDPNDPAEVTATRTLVLDEIDRMSRLIDELILLARSRRPDFVRPTPHGIGELTDDLAGKVRGLGDRTWAVDERADGTVEIDAQRITQAVVQLAKNAVGHTADADTIAIGTRLDDSTLTVWVRDTGKGIAVTDQERIFDRFFRGRDSPAEGSGLGLSIVRAIAEAHGGAVAVNSSPGQGATFTVTLPRRRTAAASPAPVAAIADRPATMRMAP